MKKSIILLLVLTVLLSNDIISQYKTVTIDQRNSINQQVGVLRKWEGSIFTDPPFNPGAQFNFLINSTQTILGDQTVISNQKYNNWNGDKTEVKNFHSFPITSQTNDLTSKFELTHTGVTIKTSLEGTSATGGYIEFKDPWFIDYQDGSYANQLRNRGMNEAYPRQRTSPFYPDSTTQYELGQKYNGVFLDQPYTGNNPVYYKVGIPSEQSIFVHGQNRKFYFQNWEASIINNFPSAQFQNQYNLETGVVFKDPNAAIKANLKGQLMSNTINGISSTSQRKIVRTDNGRYHIVYESNGNVYYTYSLTSDFNGSWQKDELLFLNAKKSVNGLLQ